MANYKKTHRGQTIDIDLIKMKHQLEHTKNSSDYVNREKDISDKRRRKNNDDKVSEMIANQEMVRKKLNEQKKQIVEDEHQEVDNKDEQDITISIEEDVKTEKPKRIIKNHGKS